jgi:hypothetical protein
MAPRDSAPIFIHTDEVTDAAFSLEVLNQLIVRVLEEPLWWKWILIILHNALQGFLVSALEYSEPLALASEGQKKARLERWEALHTPGEERRKILEGKEPLEVPRLREFPGLYEKLKCLDITSGFPFVESFHSTAQQDEAMERLHGLRNDFVHYRPGIKLKDASGYPKIVLDCLSVAEYLIFKSGSIIWPNGVKEQMRNLMSNLKAQTQLIEEKFSEFSPE